MFHGRTDFKRGCHQDLGGTTSVIQTGMGVMFVFSPSISFSFVLGLHLFWYSMVADRLLHSFDAGGKTGLLPCSRLNHFRRQKEKTKRSKQACVVAATLSSKHLSRQRGKERWTPHSAQLPLLEFSFFSVVVGHGPTWLFESSVSLLPTHSSKTSV